MSGLLHLVQRRGAWTGCGHAQSPPRCTKCDNPPINGQCINHYMMVRCPSVLMWRLSSRLSISYLATIRVESMSVVPCGPFWHHNQRGYVFRGWFVSLLASYHRCCRHNASSAWTTDSDGRTVDRTWGLTPKSNTSRINTSS